LQSDISDSVFAFVEPRVASHVIDMGQCLLNSTNDSVIVDFVTKTGIWRVRVDSINFRGQDSSAFSLFSGFPKYYVEPGSTHLREVHFQPNRLSDLICENEATEEVVISNPNGGENLVIKRIDFKAKTPVNLK
jgi:hypothetical protein